MGKEDVSARKEEIVKNLNLLSARVVDHLCESKVSDLGDPIRGKEHVLKIKGWLARASHPAFETIRTDLWLEVSMSHSLPVDVGHRLADLAGQIGSLMLG